MAQQPTAILFDLDNTLTNRRASVTKFARQFHIDFRQKHQMRRSEDMVPIIQNADGGGYRPLDERWRGLQKWIPWKDKPTAEELRDYWYTALGPCAIGVDGLHDTLTQLKDRNITLGIITNGPTGLQNATIDCLNLRQYMDCSLVSETVGIKKPDTQIYELALAELGLSRSDDIWFVGDNPATDLLGAFNMGMTTVWVHGHHDWADDSFQADYTVDNISELLTVFDMP